MSLQQAQVWRVLTTTAVLVAWAVAAHLGSAGAGNPDINAAVAVLPLLGVGALTVRRLHSGWLSVLLLVLACGLVVIAWPRLRLAVSLLYYLQHLGIHLALAAWFGMSLSGGGDALVTRMARVIHGPALSPGMVRYTRQVTVAWTGFFLANALVSTALFVWAPVAVWSVHANLMTGPLVALVFAVEYLVRRQVLPAHERPRVAEVIRAYRQQASARKAPDLDRGGVHHE
jgi:uncharacterized membrane protein